MKKVKYLFFALLCALILPFSASAEVVADASIQKGSKKVPVYMFRGEGCSHCAEAEAWFKSIKAEYGDKFELIGYETWYNKDNAQLMQDVAEARGETANGVPYIIIGDQSWSGFSNDFTTDMLNKINKVYEQDVNTRVDALKNLNIKNINSNSKKNDAVGLLIIVLVVVAVPALLYVVKQKTNQ